MNSRNRLLVPASGVLLIVSCSVATPRDSSKPATRLESPASLGVSRGSIVSIDNKQLVLAHKRKNGTSEELTFVLNPETERQGSLAAGSPVTVHYKMLDDERIATSIQPMSRTAPSSGKEKL